MCGRFSLYGVLVPHVSSSTDRLGVAGRWLTLMSLLVVVTACGDDEGGTSVRDFMESAGRVEAITVSDMYERDVSDVVIVCAYTGARAITEELGFDWSGARVLANKLDNDDSEQAVIAVQDGEVVESEVVLMDVLYLCDMDLPYPATIGAGTTLRVSWFSTPWSDGTTKTIPITHVD